MKHSILVLLGSILLMNCTRPVRTLNFQGHRGARGLFPENSLLGFEKALEIPEVSTLELDLCVTADDQLIVSHEPWLNEQICTINDSLSGGIAYNLYKMTYDSIQQFDCGSKEHPDFPEQQFAFANKPLLKELFAMIDDKGLRWPNFNIEIKSRRKGDYIYHPGPKKFADLVVVALNELNEAYPEADLLNNVSIQSFDLRILREVRKTALPVRLGLITDKTADPAKEMDALGFPVDIYSPSYELVTPELISCVTLGKLPLFPGQLTTFQKCKSLWIWA